MHRVAKLKTPMRRKKCTTVGANASSISTNNALEEVEVVDEEDWSSMIKHDILASHSEVSIPFGGKGH